MLNKVQLIGHVGQDPEIRETPQGTKVADLRLATSRYWRDGEGNRQEETEWHRVVFWGKTAENVATVLAKGRLCLRRRTNPDALLGRRDRQALWHRGDRGDLAGTDPWRRFGGGRSVEAVNENPISNKSQEIKMSEYLQKEVNELKAALEASKAEVKELSSQLSQAPEKEYQTRIKLEAKENEAQLKRKLAKREGTQDVGDA